MAYSRGNRGSGSSYNSNKNIYSNNLAYVRIKSELSQFSGGTRGKTKLHTIAFSIQYLWSTLHKS